MPQSSYYVIEDGKETGPFDLLLMIKKIRNGKVKATDTIYVQGQSNPFQAINVPELAPYFDKSSPENSSSKPPKSERSHSANPLPGSFDVGMMLKDAWVFFGDNQTASLVAGSLAIAGIAFNLFLAVLLPAPLSAIVACITAALLMFLLMAYMYRKMEGESCDPIFFQQLIKLRGVDFLICAAVAGGVPLGIPAAIGASIHPIGYVLMIPGAAGFALFIFAPLLILSNLNIRASDALKISMNWVQSQGMNAIFKITFLVAMNLIAVLVLFVPIFVSLPLSSIVLVDLFRQRVIQEIPSN